MYLCIYVSMYLCIYVSMYLSLDILYYNILYYIISLQLLHIPFSTSRSSSFSSIEDCPPRYFIFVFMFLYSCIIIFSSAHSHFKSGFLFLFSFLFPSHLSIHPSTSIKQTNKPTTSLISHTTSHFSLLSSPITLSPITLSPITY